MRTNADHLRETIQGTSEAEIAGFDRVAFWRGFTLGVVGTTHHGNAPFVVTFSICLSGYTSARIEHEGRRRRFLSLRGSGADEAVQQIFPSAAPHSSECPELDHRSRGHATNSFLGHIHHLAMLPTPGADLSLDAFYGHASWIQVGDSLYTHVARLDLASSDPRAGLAMTDGKPSLAGDDVAPRCDCGAEAKARTDARYACAKSVIWLSYLS
ncbi:uncharacterized protein B0H18DRAFT_137482 [Fomitopsis serialis]|uniref:uncharacterized protein n=1 Tax=Fomitopsis serialis TaxID=139415 RepID=UPI002008803A|nr:uncharacterized protein B0H18DRAFT_137482 [Neoantrodia serialis]KAH9914358.1 hypothetical protein B0H18DRAFT_137482 [Neoantrodia serialis]